MANFSVVVGAVLVVLGIAGYAASDPPTASPLLAAAFGLAIAMLGLYGRDAARMRTAVLLALGVAFVGFIGSLDGLFAAVRASASTPAAPPPAILSEAAMAVVLIVYVLVAIAKFRG